MRSDRQNARSRRAGFTLIELMVAMTVGALVIATVYTIGGSSARNFQEQQRVGQLQLSTRLALDRIRRDVERAGLHGTPNSALERSCAPAARAVQAVVVRDNEPTSRGALGVYDAAASNSTTQADLLRLVGNFATADAYLVRSFNGAGNVAFLQTQWQGFRRSFADVTVDPAGNTFDPTLFTSAFAPGRMLHIQNLSGSHFFVRIVSSSLAGPDATVTFAPALPVGGTCVVGLGEGALIAPLSEIEYALQASPPDLLAPLDPEITGANVGLVRRELNTGAPGTFLSSRTVLEWAVTFDVDAIMDNTPIGGVPNAWLLQLANDGNAQTQLTAQPHRVRSLVVTIGARTPEQDPDFAWVAPTPLDPLSRFRVFGARPGAARVRTATAEINLPNLGRL
ncbi:MAG: prepilin-type N-terminal cleavage/methylation domain-containing protein [Myxococcota bacterium]|nr:prepilin-type N-terminal cleavage/methylation domain-containing protein [Myxococcota bacterium]